MRTMLLVLVAGTLLHGCASEPLQPHRSLEDLTPAAWKEEVAGTPRSSLAWADFADPMLQQLIADALVNNPDITTSLTSLRSSRLNLEDAQAGRRPNYSVSTRAAGSESRGLDFSDSYSLDGMASYEVDLWGRNADDVRVAELDIITSEASLLSTRISLAAEVTEAYYALRVLDQRIDLQRETLEFALRQQEFINARHQAGIISGIDVNNQEVEVQRLRARIADLEGERSLGEQRLAVLTGRPPQQFDLTRIESSNIPQLRLMPQTPAQVLRARPDIRSAEARLRSSYIRFDQAQTSFFPSLNLTANGGYASGSLSELVRDSSLGWTLGADMIWLLLDNGARERSVERARIQAEAQVAAYRRSILNALQDVESALTSQETVLRQLEIQQLQLEAQERLTRETEARYRVGAISAIELVRQQRSLVSQRESVLTTQLQGVNAAVRLLRALGAPPL